MTILAPAIRTGVKNFLNRKFPLGATDAEIVKFRVPGPRRDTGDIDQYVWQCLDEIMTDNITDFVSRKAVRHFAIELKEAGELSGYDPQTLNMLAYFDETLQTGTGATAAWGNASTGSNAYGPTSDLAADTGTGIVPTTMNGLPAWTFLASEFESVNQGPVLSPYSIFAVFNTSSIAAGNRYLFRNVSNTAVGIFMSTATLKMDANSVLTSANLSTGVEYLAIATFDGTSAELEIPGIGTVTGDVGTAAALFGALGTSSGATDDWEGDIASLGLLNRVMTTEEKSALVASMGAKYGTLVA